MKTINTLVKLKTILIFGCVLSNLCYGQIQQCRLGEPNSFSGIYQTDGKILFASRPQHECDFMATGTGRTGLTVNFPSQMIMQINHADSFDENGQLRALGRLRLDLDGSPFAASPSFTMQHDLRTSQITINCKTDLGTVSMQICANIEYDFITIDINDCRKSPGAVFATFETDYPCQSKNIASNQCVWWHENSATLSGPSPLWPVVSGRTFGVIISADDSNSATFRTGILATNAAKRHCLKIKGLSSSQKTGFDESVTHFINSECKISVNELAASHNKWWREFWSKSCFEPDDSSARFCKFKAAYDLCRYYMACSAGLKRDWPVHFQNDLFRYSTRRHDWSELLIIGAVEHYQTLYPAMRTGNFDALMNVFDFFEKQESNFSTGEKNKAAFITYAIRGPVPKPIGTVEPNKFEMNGGSVWILQLMTDYAYLTNDQKFINGTFRFYTTGLVNLINTAYPRHDKAGKVIFYPSADGETWYKVTNSVELVSSLRSFLPRALNIAQRQKWEEESKLISDLINVLPEIPRGTLKYDFNTHSKPPVIVPSDLIAPASDMNGLVAQVLPWTNGRAVYNFNNQQNELYAIWPAKEVLSPNDLDASRRTYRAAQNPHWRVGWSADVVQAACLGLTDEVMKWFDTHFDWTYNFACGLATECSPMHPDRPNLGIYPSMQALGTGACPIFEMLMQDYKDKIILLPSWPARVPVKFRFYSPFCGRIDAIYDSNNVVRYNTERPIRVELAEPFKQNTKLNALARQLW
jgi:hypothetical protein